MKKWFTVPGGRDQRRPVPGTTALPKQIVIRGHKPVRLKKAKGIFELHLKISLRVTGVTGDQVAE